MTRGELKTIIKKNLDDVGSVFYDDTSLNDSLQDAYDDIAFLTQFNFKSTTLNWKAKNYWDFKNDEAVSDYLGTIAIFNNRTNFWLRDDLALRHFDRIRRDWENWRGNTIFWAPVNYRYIAIAPYEQSPTGTFDLKYAAIAPTFTADSDTNLVSSDMQDLFTWYGTADQLESAEEFAKAGIFWKLYYDHIQTYKERCHNLARANMVLRV